MSIEESGFITKEQYENILRELEAENRRMKDTAQDILTLIAGDFHAADWIGRKLRFICAGCPVAPDEDKKKHA